MEAFIELIEHSIEITAFVFVMMLIIEYINIITSGAWQEKLVVNKITQYFVAALLGAIPGCLGTFAAVAMYGHRIISFGVTPSPNRPSILIWKVFAMFCCLAQRLTHTSR